MARRKHKHQKHHRRHSRRGIHGFGSSAMIQELGGGVGGAIGTAFIGKQDLSKMITDPDTQKTVKAILPVAVGIGLYHFVKKNAAVRTAGIVMTSIGIANLAKTAFPVIGEICGDDDDSLQGWGDDEINGNDSLQGDATSLQGTSDYTDQY